MCHLREPDEYPGDKGSPTPWQKVQERTYGVVEKPCPEANLDMPNRFSKKKPLYALKGDHQRESRGQKPSVKPNTATRRESGLLKTGGAIEDVPKADYSGVKIQHGKGQRADSPELT